MTTAIDRAAKAMVDLNDDVMAGEGEILGASWEACASAALATTREPTPEMILAGGEALRTCWAWCDHGWHAREHGFAEAVWLAMHDAMMEEK